MNLPSPPMRFRGTTPSPMWKSVLYYTCALGGLVLLVVAAFVIFDRPVWLWLFIPLLAPWSVWLLWEYWAWVRRLGR